MIKSDLPFGSEFSPSQIELRALLETAKEVGGFLLQAISIPGLSHRGKAIFYSMGNFAFDLPMAVRTERRSLRPELSRWRSLYSIEIDPKYAEWYAWPEESRKSMIVKCRISHKRIDRVSFLPVLINTRAQPVVVPPDDEKFDKALRHMREISNSQGLNTKFLAENGEIVIAT